MTSMHILIDIVHTAQNQGELKEREHTKKQKKRMSIISTHLTDVEDILYPTRRAYLSRILLPAGQATSWAFSTEWNSVVYFVARVLLSDMAGEAGLAESVDSRVHCCQYTKWSPTIVIVAMVGDHFVYWRSFLQVLGLLALRSLKRRVNRRRPFSDTTSE